MNAPRFEVWKCFTSFMGDRMVAILKRTRRLTIVVGIFDAKEERKPNSMWSWWGSNGKKEQIRYVCWSWVALMKGIKILASRWRHLDWSILCLYVFFMLFVLFFVFNFTIKSKVTTLKPFIFYYFPFNQLIGLCLWFFVYF